MNRDREFAESIRDAIRDANLATELVELENERISVAYLPRFRSDELKQCAVSVAPRGRSTTRASRATLAVEYTLQVAVLMADVKPDSELFDALLNLVTAIEDTLTKTPTYIKSSVDELYNVDHLEQHGIFRSVITATFTGFH